MALISFQDLPSTSTPINSSNLNNNFNDVGKAYAHTATLTNGGTVVFYRYGHVVEIFHNGDISSLPAGSSTLLSSFPSEFRPYDTRRTSVHRSTNENVEIFINTDGSITAYNYSSAISVATNFQFNITYLV